MSKSPMVRAIIFDMDGVLCDNEPLHADAWLDLLEEMGYDSSSLDTRSWVGKTDISLAHSIRQQLPLSDSSEELVERKREVYWRLAEERLVPATEVATGLEELIRRGIPFALATSSSLMEVDRTLGILGLRRFFTTVVSVEDVASPKPDPEPYLLAAHRLHVDPGACLAIEDSPSGIEAAHRAGCRVCAIRTLHVTINPDITDYTVDSIQEAIQLIMSNV